MQASRILLYLVGAAALPPSLDALAQVPPHGGSSGITLSNVWQAPAHSPLGLTLGRSQSGFPCSGIGLLCDDTDRTSQLYVNTMVGNFWGLELGYLEQGRMALAGPERRTQGLNLSLVGKAPLGRSLGIYGKLGTTYGRSDTSVMGAGPAALASPGFAPSVGAGVSFSFTPRLSATLEWDSNDFRFARPGRDPVRSTSLGLQYRY